MKNKYNPNLVEQKIYSFWEKNNFFKPNNNKDKKSFCIMMPPPNVTGNLHMGHAFQQTLMDILVRYNRMKGKNTLWQTGTDHAGIATQIIIQKKIIKEKGVFPKNYTREKLTKIAWGWIKKTKKTINNQIKRLGCSVDWTRERFTLDPKISKAVQKAFIKLYHNKLIYKKKRLVNWDTTVKTVISDLEIEYREINKTFWYIKYPIYKKKSHDESSTNFIEIATTRPETLLGDVAIAVNPLDTKNNHFIGKKAIIPIINRIIPIIGDSSIKINKGSGCVKITPGHNFIDYSIAVKNKLPIISIFSSSGTILNILKSYDYCGRKINMKHLKTPIIFQHLTIFEARKKIILEIKKLGLLKNTTSIIGKEAYSDRSGSIIEPMLKTQWYLKTNSLSKKAILAVKNNSIKIFPKQYVNMYFSWMNNIQDWCISRQLWWGHRIPIWYDKEKKIYVGKNEKDIRKKYLIDKSVVLMQEKDVLDTWFSSALWTFSTLGWPKKTDELKTFHSTNVLISGFDIIFFWIARMIMLTLYFIKDKHGNPQVPFKKLYITGLIKDEQGLKMSKSKGNVIDPLDMIDGINLPDLIKKRTSNLIKSNTLNTVINLTKKQFPYGIEAMGTDALRFTFSSIASNNRFINWDMNKLKGYRNFCNKLWNASRFVINKINISKLNIYQKNIETRCILNKWINIKFNDLIKDYENNLNNFRFDIASQALYNFLWNNFCDWYLECSKLFINKNFFNDKKKLEIEYTSLNILENFLILSHPIIPFITEIIWKEISIAKKMPFTSIMLQPFPKFNSLLVDKKCFIEMKWLKTIITSVRKLRLELNIKKFIKISICVQLNDSIGEEIITKYSKYLCKLSNLTCITNLNNENNKTNYIQRIINNIIFYIPIKYKEKIIYKNNLLIKKLHKINLKIEISKKKLSNKDFLKKAPKTILLKEKIYLSKLKNKKNELLN
ncbi:valine--tRNA ligase [Buchnera aphidicola]|uniref:Valine--tRNA ligase n=1 Tax=Buchnera aphidicola (Anoecia oenotherae) TaxID=1241833 RepID=A0A4D6XVC3_9GAMM|nr:valine--tRNA ligase [Buchnera aphidicola]QCI19407.1 valine--tRNA ligase [Buchnera aphidicola (Anoecia oenotherae)]